MLDLDYLPVDLVVGEGSHNGELAVDDEAASRRGCVASTDWYGCGALQYVSAAAQGDHSHSEARNSAYRVWYSVLGVLQVDGVDLQDLAVAYLG